MKQIIDSYYYLYCRNLASKNLPAAVEDVSGDAVPDSIKEKSQTVREQGGLQSLEEKLYTLPELLTRNREILDEVEEEGRDIGMGYCVLRIYT